MQISQRQEFSIRLLYSLLPWPLSKLLPRQLGKLFFGNRGYPGADYLNNLPFSIDVPGYVEGVPTSPPSFVSDVYSHPSTSLPKPETAGVAALPPDLRSGQVLSPPAPIPQTSAYDPIPLMILKTQIAKPSPMPVLPPSYGATGKGRSGARKESLFFSRGSARNIPASVSFKSQLPLAAGSSSIQTTLFKMIQYKNVLPNKANYMQLAQRQVPVNASSGLSGQRSSFVANHTHANLYRAFKPQRNFPFFSTSGGRGGSYSITYRGNLMPFGVPAFDKNRIVIPRQTTGGTAVTLDPTWNTVGKMPLAGGNLIAGPATTPYENVRATVSHTTLKRYWEVTPNGSNIDYTRIGIMSSAWTKSSAPNNDTHCVAYYWFNNQTICFVHVQYAIADVIGVAWDIPNRLIWFRKNGVWLNTDTPQSGNGGCAVPGALDFFPCSDMRGVHVVHTFNFGASAFIDSIPSGFVAYNS